MSDTEQRPAADADSPLQPGLLVHVAYLSEDGEGRMAGVRVVEPPRSTKQAVRGNLYAVVQVDGESADSAVVSERILSTLQRTYYTARGSQKMVLSEAMNAALGIVREHNLAAGVNALTVSIACAALLNRRLQLSCCGAAFAILRSADQVELYPSDPVMLSPTAGDDARECEVLRWEMGAEDALLLAGPAWAEVMPLKTLAATVYYVSAGTVEDAAEGLREQAGSDPGAGLLLATEEDLAGPPSKPASPLTSGRRTAPGALPTSLGAPPPVSAPPTAAKKPTGVPPVPTVPPAGVSSQPVAAGNARSTAVVMETHGAGPSELEAIAAAIPAFLMRDSATEFPTPEVGVIERVSDDLPADLGPSATERLIATARGMSVRARELLVQMLPERKDASSDFESVEEGMAPSVGYPEKSAATATVAVDDLYPIDADVLKPLPFHPPAPSTGGRARLFVLLALLLALLVPVVVYTVSQLASAPQEAEAATLITLAQARMENAQEALDAEDKRSALNLLSEAEDFLDSSVELVGATAPANELRRQIRALEREAAEVQSLYGLVSPLITFPSGAAPTRMIVQDQDVYVMDPGRGVVERYRMDQSLGKVPDQIGDPLLRAGETVDGSTVGTPVDMAWLPVVPGFDDKASLLVLDDTNQLFRYDPRVEGPSRIELAGSAGFEQLTQVETYLGRVYLADTGAGQLKRYPSGDYTKSIPSDWFVSPMILDDMRSLQIDGEVWILLKTGQVLRFSGGQQVEFALDDSIGLVQDAADFFVGEGDQGAIYIADAGGERVWVYSKAGEYLKQLAAPEGDPLDSLSGMYVEEVTDSLYLLTSGALFKHPLPEN